MKILHSDPDFGRFSLPLGQNACLQGLTQVSYTARNWNVQPIYSHVILVNRAMTVGGKNIWGESRSNTHGPVGTPRARNRSNSVARIPNKTWQFPDIGATPIAGWLMNNLIEMDDLGLPWGSPLGEPLIMGIRTKMGAWEDALRFNHQQWENKTWTIDIGIYPWWILSCAQCWWN